VDMATKTQPVQDRSRTTYEAILTAAGELLEEIGIERFSTNLVCQRAGLTPPALYRYFPNKYALLKELGIRLLAAHGEVMFRTMQKTPAGTVGPARSLIRARQRQQELNRVTREFPGGAWILRAMRAVPLLRDVRRDAVELAADRILLAMRERFPLVSEARLSAATRLAVELSFLATEIALDEAEDVAESITQEIAVMMVQYFMHLTPELPGAV